MADNSESLQAMADEHRAAVQQFSVATANVADTTVVETEAEPEDQPKRKRKTASSTDEPVVEES
jgi:hypothetical protein